jgi:hypothetical protein
MGYRAAALRDRSGAWFPPAVAGLCARVLSRTHPLNRSSAGREIFACLAATEKGRDRMISPPQAFLTCGQPCGRLALQGNDGGLIFRLFLNCVAPGSSRPSASERKGVSILLAGPLNSGILATGAVLGATYNYQPAPPAIMERVGRLETVCRRHGVDLATAALQFPLAHPAWHPSSRVRCIRTR